VKPLSRTAPLELEGCARRDNGVQPASQPASRWGGKHREMQRATVLEHVVKGLPIEARWQLVVRRPQRRPTAPADVLVQGG
jgi:hypothetical protein